MIMRDIRNKYGFGRQVTNQEGMAIGVQASDLTFFNHGSSGETPGNGMELKAVVGIIEVLKGFGGPTKSTLVKEQVAASDLFTDEEREQISQKTGKSILDMRVQFAMSNLKRAGLLFSPERGVWALTEKGEQIDLNEFDLWDDVYKVSTPIWKKAREEKQAKKQQMADELAAKGQTPVKVVVQDDEIEDESDEDAWKDDLLDVLNKMNHFEFERLVTKLLQKMGMQMQTTVKTGDGGVDGLGILQTEELLRYRVAFQAKKYTDQAVGSVDINNFSGALQAVNADRGIFVTTSSYNKGAVERAEQGSNMITLVDGYELADLLLKYKIGVREVSAIKIDEDYFLGK